MNFSPIEQNSILNVQTRLREIDMALHPSVVTSLGHIRTFAYSTLAACCDFLDEVQKGGYTDQVEIFAKNIVAPAVDKCFEEIETAHFKLNEDTLKLNLVNHLKTVQMHTRSLEFSEDRTPDVIEKLKTVIKNGELNFYKLKENDSKYYGGIINIDPESFQKAASILEENGYKEPGDLLGSSNDVGPHVTAVFSKELSEKYDHIMQVFDNLESKTISLEPIAIRYGNLPAGILSKVCVIRVHAPQLEAYRKSCGLNELTLPLLPPAHVSVFSKYIQPLKCLVEQKTTFSEYINRESTNLKRMHNTFAKGNISS